MKTMMKLGLALLVFGVVLAVLASFALRMQGEPKRANKVSVSASASEAASAHSAASLKN